VVAGAVVAAETVWRAKSGDVVMPELSVDSVIQS
jgi:hypothetical protein